MLKNTGVSFEREFLMKNFFGHRRVLKIYKKYHLNNKIFFKGK